MKRILIDGGSFISKHSPWLLHFEQRMLELWCYTWVILVLRPFTEYHFFDPYYLDLGVWPIHWKPLHCYNIWLVSARVSLKYFLWPICYPVPMTLVFDLFLHFFYYTNNIWTVSASALMFYTNIPCDMIFLINFQPE